MLLYKKIDFWVQVMLVAGALMYGLSNQGFEFIVGYIIVGIWQVLSTIIHGVSATKYAAISHRKFYSIVILISGLIACIIAYVPGLEENSIAYGMILLFVSPILALWYLFICKKELDLLQHRAMIHLKK